MSKGGNSFKNLFYRMSPSKFSLSYVKKPQTISAYEKEHGYGPSSEKGKLTDKHTKRRR